MLLLLLVAAARTMMTAMMIPMTAMLVAIMAALMEGRSCLGPRKQQLLPPPLLPLALDLHPHAPMLVLRTPVPLLHLLLPSLPPPLVLAALHPPMPLLLLLLLRLLLTLLLDPSVMLPLQLHPAVGTATTRAIAATVAATTTPRPARPPALTLLIQAPMPPVRQVRAAHRRQFIRLVITGWA